MPNNTIAILLATYNSSKYIREQIDSLLSQTYKDFIIYVRDDCSTDKTPIILQDYKNRYPERFVIVDNEGKSLRAYHNFVELMYKVESPYYMFCDHDDVWLSDKIEVSMARMQQESLNHTDKPIIVHTDMMVVDQNLNIINESFWSYTKLLPKHVRFKDLVCCNSVNGCTVLLNNKAKQVALQNVDNATMHDMLVAQSVAANGGIVAAVMQPTVLYRQHIDNVVGAHERNREYYIKKAHNLKAVWKDNINWWQMSRRIRKYSFLSYMLTKVKINMIKILKYKVGIGM